MAGVEGQVKQEELDAQRDVLRRLALGQVRQYPDPVLRMRANDVTEFDGPLEALVERMSRLMHDAGGVGLAAPQVGVLRRVFVYQAGQDTPLQAVVNPVIVTRSDDIESVEEGCLSLGATSVVVDVERSVTIAVEARSPQGEELRIEAEGLEARVIQHELDHLDGVLIIDRASPEQRRAALGQLRPPPILGARDARALVQEEA